MSASYHADLMLNNGDQVDMFDKVLPMLSAGFSSLSLWLVNFFSVSRWRACGDSRHRSPC
jgi:hypothetical protein